MPLITSIKSWPLQDRLQWLLLVEWTKHFRREEMVIFSLNWTWTWFQTTFFMMRVYCQRFEERIKNLRDISDIHQYASVGCATRRDIDTASWLLHPWHPFPSILRNGCQVRLLKYIACIEVWMIFFQGIYACVCREGVLHENSSDTLSICHILLLAKQKPQALLMAKIKTHVCWYWSLSCKV